MFTGIVQHLGKVIDVTPAPHGLILQVDRGEWAQEVQDGDSIAVNGCCLTAISLPGAVEDGRLRFDVIPQTLQATALGDLVTGSDVNLEAPVTPSTLMSGHIVQGHIDGVADVIEVRDDTEYRIRLRPPAPLQAFILDKGSVALNGVSMTVAAAGGAAAENCFEVALIPTTREMTNLGALRSGSRVNLEVDYLVKAVVNWARRGGVVEPMLPEGSASG